MNKNLSRLIWPVTVLVSAAMIGAGVYFGLRSAQPSAAPTYGVPSAGPAVDETDTGRMAPAEGTTIVYVTRTGECYHRASCTSLSRSRIPMELSEAKKRYRPCSRCNPPR